MGDAGRKDCVPDLRREREKCLFDVEELTNVIDGGKEKTKIRRQFRESVTSDPALKDQVPIEYLNHEERYANELRKSCHLAREMAHLGTDMQAASQIILRDGSPLLIHYSVFIPAIAGQGDEEQLKGWLERIRRGEVFGTYAQTELGHGSFIRGLETTATYDPTTQEFVIHSPTLTATKWWPGGLANSSSHAVVMGVLYSKGVCHGPHMFIVQLRDSETFETLPGITLGEIGPRMGLNANDNGFVRFDRVRIPRRNMLMRFSQVLEDGTFVKPAHSKLSYITMVKVRVGIAGGVCRNLQQAVTIATRYSAVRHQSELVPGEPEPQILDYQTQQYKLIPQIASVFALIFASRKVSSTYQSVSASMDKGDLSLLPELHCLSSGTKAIAAFDCSSGIEICRLACGGHGYLASSNLPRLYTGTTCAITYEGENTILLLQVARYLIKSYRSARKGVKLRHSVSYLASNPASSDTCDLSNKGLVEAYKRSALSLIASSDRRLQNLCDSGQDYHHAWNSCSIMLVKGAEAHMRYYLCEQYVHSIETGEMSDDLRKVLRNLCRLYLIYHISLKPGHFLKSGALSSGDVALLEEEMCGLLASLRHQAVSLVDAFDFEDVELSSTLGAWDGDVYQRLFDEAMKSPMNKTDVPDAYYKYLRPLMKSGMKSNL